MVKHCLVLFCFYMRVMMESIFSFLPSYFSILFWAKSKISKSISLFLSHIGPKRCWPIRFQDFKSNMSREQSEEIVYFSTCWYWKLRVDRKVLGWLWSEVVATTWSQGEWMNELSWFFACSYMVSGRLKLTLGIHMVKYDCDILGPGILKSAMSQE